MPAAPPTAVAAAAALGRWAKKMKIVLVLIVSLALSACNTYGPYDGSITQLAPSLYHVTIGTWIGSGRGWPNGNEDLKSKAESAAKAALKERGVAFDVCDFDGFIPYEGGHMTVSLIAGSKPAVDAWRALSTDEQKNIFLARSGLDVGRFRGLLPDLKEAPNQ